MAGYVISRVLKDVSIIVIGIEPIERAGVAA
jgi:hypothetical protein